MDYSQQEYPISIRQVCKLLDTHPSVYRYKPKRKDWIFRPRLTHLFRELPDPGIPGLTWPTLVARFRKWSDPPLKGFEIWCPQALVYTEQ